MKPSLIIEATTLATLSNQIRLSVEEGCGWGHGLGHV